MWDAVDHLDKVRMAFPKASDECQGLQLIVCKVIAEKLTCFKTEQEARDVTQLHRYSVYSVVLAQLADVAIDMSSLLKTLFFNIWLPVYI